MYLTLDYIQFFINEKNLDKNIDSGNFKNILGISKIEKKENLWEICIRGPKDSLYEGGLFNLTINFPLLYPQKSPDVRFVNKIYHLNVCPINGRINAFFLLNWDANTSYAELLVGIYLFFIFEQNQDSPYSRDMAVEYRNNRNEFDKNVKLWVTKYAREKQSGKESEKQTEIQLGNQNILNEEENKYDFLVKKVNKLENDLKTYSNKIIELLEKLNSNNQNEEIPNNLISVIFQSLSKNLQCSIICKETDVFVNIESALYKKYPEYLESEQYFVANGKKINKFKTLKENGISDSSVILLYPSEISGQWHK